MSNMIIGVVVLIYLGGVVYYLRGTKLNTHMMCMIGIFAAISVILKTIAIPLPTGSKIAFFSVLPTMVLSVCYGARAGVLSGMLTGLLAILVIPGYTPIHPLQIPVEHLGALGAIGFAGLLGSDKKGRMLLMAFIAVSLNVLFHTFSGVLFFSQNAPAGQGAWVYSLTYNISAHGTEGLLSIIILGLLPLKQLKHIIGGKR